jgi:hypothetical protein
MLSHLGYVFSLAGEGELEALGVARSGFFIFFGTKVRAER